MIKVDESLTRHVAHLSRLTLSDSEVTAFTAHMENILKYVDKLQEVNVDHTEPLIHPLDLGTPLREDEVHPSPVNSEGKPKVLDSAPEVLYDGYKVPQIL